MNKQSLNKLSLFLTGMEQRLIDNWEFFKGITAVFKSGTREFPAKVWQDGNKLKMNFSAVPKRWNQTGFVQGLQKLRKTTTVL